MPESVRITPQAREDIVGIADYIALDSLDAAERFLDAVESTSQELARMPQLGTLCGFSHPEAVDVRVRTISGFANHLIFYRPIDAGVLIVRVLHGARDWQSLFK